MHTVTLISEYFKTQIEYYLNVRTISQHKNKKNFEDKCAAKEKENP